MPQTTGTKPAAVLGGKQALVAFEAPAQDVSTAEKGNKDPATAEPCGTGKTCSGKGRCVGAGGQESCVCEAGFAGDRGLANSMQSMSEL